MSPGRCRPSARRPRPGSPRPQLRSTTTEPWTNPFAPGCRFSYRARPFSRASFTMTCTRASTVEWTEIRPRNRSSTPKMSPPYWFSSSKTCWIAAGASIWTSAWDCHVDGLGLAELGESFGDVPVARHQGQDLVAATERPRVAGRRSVVPGRLADPREQRRLSRVLQSYSSKAACRSSTPSRPRSRSGRCPGR